jgi:hypothetical protein
MKMATTTRKSRRTTKLNNTAADSLKYSCDDFTGSPKKSSFDTQGFPKTTRPMSAPAMTSSQNSKSFNVLHPPGTFTTRVSEVKPKPEHLIDPIPPTNNSKLLTFHEKLFYNKYLTTYEAEMRKPPLFEVKDVPNSIQFAHRMVTTQKPSSETLTNYCLGRSTLAPLRIVEYNKSGLLYRRDASDKSHRGIKRNALGGYFAS